MWKAIGELGALIWYLSGLRGRSPANSNTAMTIARTRVATSTQENGYPRTQWGMGHPTKRAEGTNPKTLREKHEERGKQS